jgi:citrate synthase
MATETPTKAGLEDVVVASSSICYLDGSRGVLAYRGYDIHDLAEHATFEEVCYLLWHGRLPNRAEIGELQSELAASRRLPEGILRLIRSLPPSSSMDVLRTVVSALSQFDAGANDMSPQGRYRTSVKLTAQIGTVVATCGRVAAGGGAIDPDPALGHAASFLYMVCRAGCSRHADRRALRRDRSHWRAEGTIARWCEHRRDAHALRDRAGRVRREG